MAACMLGMGRADQRLLRDRAVEAVLNEQLMPGLSADLDELQQEAVSAMVQQGVPLGHIRCEHRLHLRYLGSDTALVVEFKGLRQMTEAFDQAHRQRFGFYSRNKALIVEAMQVEAIGMADKTQLAADPHKAKPALQPCAHHSVVMNGRRRDIPFYRRDDLSPGDRLTGPAVITEVTGTIVLEPEIGRASCRERV